MTKANGFSAGDSSLKGKKFAILATNGVEQVELVRPRQALLDAGAEVVLVSPVDASVMTAMHLKRPKIQMWNHDEKGDQMEIDLDLNEAKAEDFDGLVLPGGVMNPDQLRTNPKAVEFVAAFAERRAPIAAICHGPWLLAEAGVIEGVQLTSWPSIKTDLINAGAAWEDSKVVCDRNFVTSRKPDDLPDFNRQMISLFATESVLGRMKTQPSLELRH